MITLLGQIRNSNSGLGMSMRYPFLKNIGRGHYSPLIVIATGGLFALEFDSSYGLLPILTAHGHSSIYITASYLGIFSMVLIVIGTIDGMITRKIYENLNGNKHSVFFQRIMAFRRRFISTTLVLYTTIFLLMLLTSLVELVGGIIHIPTEKITEGIEDTIFTPYTGALCVIFAIVFYAISNMLRNKTAKEVKN
jgi:hypothetical protein